MFLLTPNLHRLLRLVVRRRLDETRRLRQRPLRGPLLTRPNLHEGFFRRDDLVDLRFLRVEPLAGRFEVIFPPRPQQSFRRRPFTVTILQRELRFFRRAMFLPFRLIHVQRMRRITKIPPRTIPPQSRYFDHFGFSFSV